MTSARTFAAALALLSVTGTARADADDSTVRMMEQCKPVMDIPDGDMTSSAAYDSGLCAGAFLVLHNFSTAFGVCPPQNSTMLQAVRIFDAYARRHPEIQHKSFQITALRALREAWPCK